MARPLAPLWKPAPPSRGRAAAELGHSRSGWSPDTAAEEPLAGACVCSTFPTLQPPGAISLGWGGGWGSPTWRTQPRFRESGAWRREVLRPRYRRRAWGPPRASAPAGPGLPGARLRRLPSPSPGNRIWRPPFSFLSVLAAFFFLTVRTLLCGLPYQRIEVGHCFPSSPGRFGAVLRRVPSVSGARLCESAAHLVRGALPSSR